MARVCGGGQTTARLRPSKVPVVPPVSKTAHIVPGCLTAAPWPPFTGPTAFTGLYGWLDPKELGPESRNHPFPFSSTSADHRRTKSESQMIFRSRHTGCPRTEGNPPCKGRHLGPSACSARTTVCDAWVGRPEPRKVRRPDGSCDTNGTGPGLINSPSNRIQRTQAVLRTPRFSY